MQRGLSISQPLFMFSNVQDTQDEDQVKSILTNFMTWASLTRDVEMQKGKRSSPIYM